MSMASLSMVIKLEGEQRVLLDRIWMRRKEGAKWEIHGEEMAYLRQTRVKGWRNRRRG